MMLLGCGRNVKSWGPVERKQLLMTCPLRVLEIQAVPLDLIVSGILLY
jgi:hypothetical protein